MSASRCIALIRGINVGRAKRIAMADLRDLVSALGHNDARTLLNSGNVLFDAKSSRTSAIAHAIEAGIVDRFGISARVIVITATQLNAIVSENPLRSVATDPSRYMVAFVANPSALAKARPLLQESWLPESFAIGARAAYLWCAGGVLDSKVAKAFGRLSGDTVTTRNWATVLKLQQAASADRNG